MSQPGGAGHALLFRDQIIVKKDFKNFPSDALTFETWISSSDFCHAGTVLSYAKDSKSKDEAQRVADFNHFVVFDPRVSELQRGRVCPAGDSSCNGFALLIARLIGPLAVCFCVLQNLLACHDFEFIDLVPDEKGESCHAAFRNVSGSDDTVRYVERDGQWHHLAVTWSTADEGLTKIHWDGLLGKGLR